jgi:hypothetical protein
MKKTLLIILLLGIFFTPEIHAQDELPPYFGTTLEKGIDELKDDVQSTIDNSGYDIIGSYQVAGKPHLYSIAFTSAQLQKLCGDYNDRGALASVLKVGLYEKDGKTEVSILNPRYMFYAYFGEDYKMHQEELDAIDKHIKEVIKILATSPALEEVCQLKNLHNSTGPTAKVLVQYSKHSTLLPQQGLHLCRYRLFRKRSFLWIISLRYLKPAIPQALSVCPKFWRPHQLWRRFVS